MGGGEVIELMSDPKYEDLMPSIRGWLLESPFCAFPKGEEPGSLTVFFGRLAGRILPHKQMFSPIPPEKCTRDPAVIASLNADKLLHGTGTLEGLAGMLDRTALIGKGKTVLNKGVKSIWLGHGTADFGTSYPASKKWFEEQKEIEDKEFKTYEGWSHQLHADLAENRSIFANDVADWILARCGETKGDGSKL
jgi:acylglycerol lipase